jgi:hypothetical protein
VYGGINDIQGRAFGHLTLAIRGADAAIDAALARIAERVDVTEPDRTEPDRTEPDRTEPDRTEAD